MLQTMSYVNREKVKNEKIIWRFGKNGFLNRRTDGLMDV